MNASPHNLSRQQVMALLEERDTLLEQVRQLEEALAPKAILPRTWRLTATEERLLRALRAVGPNVLHHERAMLALYGMLDEAPQQKILDVLICKIRRKLMEAQAQIRIETIWGRGWRLSPESCARFDALVGEDRARWTARARAVA
ncbi:MAG: helix-turn-helix domain-containing protein [Parafilimonas terrae]|nr:helix-turn-helix domain-containing protein [Parafilimonas terrae]